MARQTTTPVPTTESAKPARYQWADLLDLYDALLRGIRTAAFLDDTTRARLLGSFSDAEAYLLDVRPRD